MGLPSRVFFDHYIYNLFYPDIDYVFSRIYHCFLTFFSVSISGKLRAKRTRYLGGKHNLKGTKWNINRKNTASQWETGKGDLLCNLTDCVYNLFGNFNLAIVF